MNALASGLDDGTAGNAGVVGTEGSAGALVATAPFEAAEFKLGSFGISGLATGVGAGAGVEVAAPDPDEDEGPDGDHLAADPDADAGLEALLADGGLDELDLEDLEDLDLTLDDNELGPADDGVGDGVVLRRFSSFGDGELRVVASYFTSVIMRIWEYSTD